MDRTNDYLRPRGYYDNQGNLLKVDFLTLNLISGLMVSAGILNTIDGIKAVRVYNSTNISISANVTTNLTFDSERYDTNDMHSTAVNTSRLTCNGSGIYSIGGSVDWSSSSSGDRQIIIYQNTSNIIAAERQYPGLSGFSNLTINTQYYLSSGDYVELAVKQTASASVNVLAAPSYSPEFFMMKRG
jgi:uncharacterized membrane protein